MLILVETGTSRLSPSFSANVGTGQVDSSNLVLVGASDYVGVFGGYSNANSPIQVGVYATYNGRGGGAYFNLVPSGGCHY